MSKFSWLAVILIAMVVGVSVATVPVGAATIYLAQTTTSSDANSSLYTSPNTSLNADGTISSGTLNNSTVSGTSGVGLPNTGFGDVASAWAWLAAGLVLLGAVPVLLWSRRYSQ